MSLKPLHVLGFGAPILDLILHVSKEYLATVPGELGGMEPVDYDTQQQLIAKSASKPVMMLGGSACNVLRGLKQFGVTCTLLGKVGSGHLGQRYLHLIEQADIRGHLPRSDKPNTIVLSMVGPCGQRTMRTYVGASAEITSAEIPATLFDGVAHMHVEGYSFYYQEPMFHAFELAKQKGVTISLDLASFEVVRAFRPAILNALTQYVDIVFANEMETAAMTGEREEAGCDMLAEICPVAVVMMGKEGAWVKRGREKIHCPTQVVENPIDTTGAGDLFAAGFLYGYLDEQPLVDCGRLGSLAGAAVVQEIGPEIPAEKWAEILNRI